VIEVRPKVAPAKLAPRIAGDKPGAPQSGVREIALVRRNVQESALS